jgi:hypothetical protein
MVKKIKEITPLKAVLIYSIALILVVFSELPRVLSWVEEIRCKLVSAQMFDSLGANQLKLVSETSDPPVDAVPLRDDPTRQADAEGIEAVQPVVNECPPEQDADQQVAPPDTSGAGNEESPAARSERQPNEQATPAPGTSSPKLKPHKVLLVGDSMIAEGFGPALQRRLSKNTSLQVVRKGQYSTGFVHQEDFNWASALKELILKNEPDVIIIHMGTNDPIDILDDSGKRLYFGNDKWTEVYASRVKEFLKFASEKKILSFWVGLPITLQRHLYLITAFLPV